jgi:muramidase (phage lysozyme)
MAGFTDPPKTTDPVEILRYFQDKTYTPKSEQTGIASKPVTDDRTSGVMKFFADWWTESEEKVAKAREEIAPDMEELARRSSEEAALYRMEQATTQALTEGDDEAFRTETAEGISPRPVTRPSVSADSMSDSKDEQEAAPVTVAPDAVDVAVAEALEAPATTQGNGLMSRTSTPTVTPSEKDATQELLDRIAEGEGAEPEKLQAQAKHGIGTTPYDMVYNYGNTVAPSKPVTEMTLKELEAFQRKLINATKGKVKGTSQGTSAVGKYQVVKTSLFGKGGTAENPKKNSWADKLGLKADTVYTPEVQEAIGMLALKEAGYNAYINGKRSQDAFQNRIANIWASVAKADGTDTYGQGIHTFKKDLQPMLSALAPQRNKQTVPKESLRPKTRPERTEE